MSDLAARTWVCLCRPSDVRNVAGVIRAVANFGLAGVKLVTEDHKLHDPDDLLAFSSGASKIVTLKVYPDITSALTKASLAVGTSRRQRNHQHLTHLESCQITTALIDHESPHILFGNERTGLSHDELDLCHAIVELHSTSTFPSLNLAHAVACVAYELTRPRDIQSHHVSATDSSALTAALIPPVSTSIVEDEAFLNRVIEVSQRVKYPPSKSSERFARQLRSLLRRARATPGDYGLILGIFRELERLDSKHDRRET